ncbi:hypothetical protein GCM10008960_35220 [Deinococcus sedimenti]|uniref:Uncharacterized protein n=2 Tax=Deinococcus sedimenti TaxID=1867090 RepID=A0ABQ2S7V4_9DEIO|nr:hypothetical protein GCM10008960_35220 [Deinococcus sedimenti]
MGQASRAMAYGRSPVLPFEVWKPKPERQRVPAAKVRLDGVLVMLEYGLRVMSDARLSSLGGVLRDELRRNGARWIPQDVKRVQRGAEQIELERRRREAALNDAAALKRWGHTSAAGAEWTQADADRLRAEWENVVSDEDES